MARFMAISSNFTRRALKGIDFSNFIELPPDLLRILQHFRDFEKAYVKVTIFKRIHFPGKIRKKVA